MAKFTKNAYLKQIKDTLNKKPQAPVNGQALLQRLLETAGKVK